MGETKTVSPELLARVAQFSTPELCDGMEPYHAMYYEVKPWVGGKIVGPAFTADVPMGSSDLVARAIDQAREGDILVLAGKGNCCGSLWGDFKSLCAKSRKLCGVVIDGAFRDLNGCKEVGFPIYARAVVCGAVEKTDYGALNVPVSCAGVVVRPGDIVVGDENGVCVLPFEQVENILARAGAKAEKQMQKEMEVCARIKEMGMGE